jgi:ketosteroid isomerase-like protein
VRAPYASEYSIRSGKIIAYNQYTDTLISCEGNEFTINNLRKMGKMNKNTPYSFSRITNTLLYIVNNYFHLTTLYMKTSQFSYPHLVLALVLVLAFSSCSSNKEREELAKLQVEFSTLKSEHQKQADELAIRNLAERFSDAANRKDGEAFQALWAPDGQWIIGPPINVEFKGKENMGPSVTHMLGLWDFFVQLSGPGVVVLDGDSATARFYVNEIARGKDGKGNYNLSMYDDELVKTDGVWYFKTRTYKTIYQDAPFYKGIVQDISK